MKKKIKNKDIKKSASKSKTLAGLLKDEDGFVSKDTIFKIGLSTVAALGVAGSLTDISVADGHTNAGPNTAIHNNAVTNANNCINHTNVTTHTSY